METVIVDNSAIDQWRLSQIPAGVLAQITNFHITPCNFQELLLMTNNLSREDRIKFLYSKAGSSILQDTDELERREQSALLASLAEIVIPDSELISAPSGYWYGEWAQIVSGAGKQIPTSTINSLQQFKDGQRRQIIYFAAVLSEMGKIRKTATMSDFVRIQQSIKSYSEIQLKACIPVPTDKGILAWVDSNTEAWGTIASYRYLIERGFTEAQVDAIDESKLKKTGCWLSNRYLIELARDFVAGQYREPEGGDAFDARQLVYLPYVKCFVTKDGYFIAKLRKILTKELSAKVITF